MLRRCEVCNGYVWTGSCAWSSTADAYKKVYTVFGSGAAERAAAHLMSGNSRKRRGKNAAK